MSPLTLGGSAEKVPEEFGELLHQLGARPHPALVHYDGSAAADAETSRIELSGRVLANWATKLIGLLVDEHDLSTEDVVLVDMVPHWKAAAVALAAGSSGAEVRLRGGHASGAYEEPSLVVTDRPLEWVNGDDLGDAELVAVSLGMLDGSFQEATGQQLPGWVTDVSAEARQYPDQLMAPLASVALPDAGSENVDSPLILREWDSDSFSKMLGTWAAGGVVVLFQGSADGELWQRMLRNEGVSELGL